ncbi:hypothetical protein QBC42DRAFT_279010 [Cladorrhinum samala]|uniref:protein disulfide-isomerase n=1 Tax=Cladorrhinum samala TaxID=585594 RepID=A0AAV9HEF6_9PEZI|nr:hypothetical protein QBC42DRAFT_279010 [Cladorrhinum samala]
MPAYPSIWLLGKDKEVVRYKGAKRADAFLHFLSRKSRPLITEIKTGDQLNLFKTADETVFVAYLDPSDTDSRGAFERVAQKYSDEFSFGIVSDQELAQTQQNVKVPAVVGYKVIDGDVVIRKGEVGNVDEFEGWIKETSRGVIGELTLLNQQRLIDRAWPIVYLFAPTEKERQKLRKTLYKFARSYYDSLTAVTVDPHEFPDLMSKLGLDPDCASPAGAVHQLSKDRIYPYPKGQPLTPGAIQNWGMDIYNGRVKPWTPPGSAKTAEGEKEEDDNNNNNNGFIKFTNKKNKVAAGTKRKVVSMANIPGVKIKIAGRDEL